MIPAGQQNNMKSYLPQQNKKYLQTNRSNIEGNLWSTTGLDFQSNIGAVRLSQKLVTNTTSSDDADLGRPGAFAYYGQKWWAICGTRIFVSTSFTDQITSPFTEDTSAAAQTSYDPNTSDLALFNDLLWASYPSKLYSGTGSAWTNRTSTATLDGQTQKLLYFKFFDRLYFVNTYQKIGSINTSNVVAVSGDYSINLGNSIGVIQTMVATGDKIWISAMRNNGVSTTEGSYGSVFEWDGISAQATNEYILTTAGLVTMVVYQNIVYGMDTEGRILKFVGYGFEEVSRLPINVILLLGATYNDSGARFIHMNGLIATKNNTLLFAIQSNMFSPDLSIVENIPSGVWEVDLATGSCTHKYLFTLKGLASSTITDFGQIRVSEIGALAASTFNAIPLSAGRSTLLVGARYFTDATTEKYAIFIDSPTLPTTDNEGQKKGSFVTTYFDNTESAEEQWQRIWSKYRKYLDSSDKIVFKYRTSEIVPTEATITWVTTTSFTTTTDITAYGPTATGFDGYVGGEVEILNGTGGNSCSHITNIVNNAGTYTVTLDETITGVTNGTAKARFQKWIKIGEVSSVYGLLHAWQQLAIRNANEARIQVKCCMTFTGNGEFYQAVITSEPNVKIT